MVNSLEHNLLEAEWGNWLAAETGRCEAVVQVLMEEEEEGDEEEMVKVWNALKKYCGSCEKEQKMLLGGVREVEAPKKVEVGGDEL